MTSATWIMAVVGVALGAGAAVALCYVRSRQLAHVLTAAEQRNAEQSARIAMLVDQTDDMARTLIEIRTDLRRSEGRFQSLIGTAATLVWTSDASGLTTTVDGVTAGPELRRRDQMYQQLHPDDLDRTRAAWELAVARGERFEYEARLIIPPSAKTGHEVWATHRHCVLRAIPLRDDAGQVREWIGTVADVHEQRLAEQATRGVEAAFRERLEQMVQERTRQLEATNRELEGFSYSVSHDLRAPLRSIDGFASILLREYGERLDDRGRDYLERSKRATERMARLIDDMLNLSRLARRALNPAAVDFTALAGSVAEALSAKEPDRDVTFRIEPGVRGAGDPTLLRSVIENLLGNAWKFTSRRQGAVIGFGRLSAGEGHDENVYYVRDNGVGFDMTYAGKLFGAFQRLHSPQEFPGTGVGLASVQRIVSRHGGRVWGEGSRVRGRRFISRWGEERRGGDGGAEAMQFGIFQG